MGKPNLTLLVVLILVAFSFLHDNASASSLNPTSVSISASSPIVQAGQTITISVSTKDTSFMPTTPSGNVTFTDDNAGGNFSPVSCSLYYGNCTTTYTTNIDPNPIIVIYASYAGDSTHIGSQTTVQISTGLTDRTITKVTPSSLSFTNSNPITVSAIVMDTVYPTNSLIGMISFTDNSAGGNFSPTNCVLVSNKCTLTYTPPPALPTGIILTATYAGDSNHSSSVGTIMLENLAPITPAVPLSNVTGMKNCFNQGGSWNPITQSCAAPNTTQTTVPPPPPIPQVTYAPVPSSNPFTTVLNIFNQLFGTVSSLIPKH